MKCLDSRRAQLLLVCLAAALACAKGDAPRANSARTATRMPGTLAKALDEYSGDELYTFAHQLNYAGGHQRDRKCAKDPACQGTKRTKVYVDGIATQDSIGPKTTPPFGVMYVRAVNRGDAEEARYGMAPGRQFEYYVILSADSVGMKWRLEQLDTTPGARRHVQIGTGAFIGCKHKWARGAGADFKSCKQAASAHDSVVHLGLMLQGSDDDPIWMPCTEGCCVADR